MNNAIALFAIVCTTMTFEAESFDEKTCAQAIAECKKEPECAKLLKCAEQNKEPKDCVE